MARKTRMEVAHGLYHVLHRGNYRRWIFEEEGAKNAFETTLFEACKRAKWVLHGYCVIGNRFHFAPMTTNRWLGYHLNMGPPAAVCRYVAEAVLGDRSVAAQCRKS